MPLLARAGTPKTGFNIRGPSTLALAFQGQFDCAKVDLTIILNIGSVFLHPDVNLVDPLDFTGFSLTKAAAASTNAATAAAATSQAAATVAAAAIAATLPTNFFLQEIFHLMSVHIIIHSITLHIL